MKKAKLARTSLLIAHLALIALVPDSNVVAAESPFLLGPPETDGPTVVSVGFNLTDINAIDEETETVAFQAIIIMKWQDSRQAFDPLEAGVDEKIYQGEFQFNEVFNGWWPQMVLFNSSGSYERQGVTLRIEPDGSMTYVEAFNAVAETRLHVQKFPFDAHSLELIFGVLGFWSSEIRIESDPRNTGFKEFGASVSQWAFRGLHAEVREDHPVNEGSAEKLFSLLAVTLEVARKPEYILRVIAIPLIMLIILTWSVFWMDRESLGTRMDISFLGLLTVVAFQIVVSENLPRISYNTLFDTFLYVCYGVLCVSVLTNLVVGRLDREGKVQAGDRVDRTARWLVPLGYFGAVALAGLYFTVAY